MDMFLRLGAGAHTMSLSWKALMLESFKVLSTHQTTVPWLSTAPQHSPLIPLCFCTGWFTSPVLLTFTLMFNPILTVSSFSPPSRSASHEYPKVCLLDRIIPLFKATGDNSSATENTLNGSSALSLCFFRFPLLSLSLPSVFVPLGFYQTHWSTRSGSSSAAPLRLLDTQTHTHAHTSLSGVLSI